MHQLARGLKISNSIKVDLLKQDQITYSQNYELGLVEGEGVIKHFLPPKKLECQISIPRILMCEYFVIIQIGTQRRNSTNILYVLLNAVFVIYQ